MYLNSKVTLDKYTEIFKITQIITFLVAPSLTWAHTGAAQSLSEALRHILLSLFCRRILLIQQNDCLDPAEDSLRAQLSAVGFQQLCEDCAAQHCCTEATGLTGLPN